MIPLAKTSASAQLIDLLIDSLQKGRCVDLTRCSRQHMVNNNTHRSFEVRIREDMFFVFYAPYKIWCNEFLFMTGLFLDQNSYSELNFIERERGFVSVASFSKERKCSVPISFFLFLSLLPSYFDLCRLCICI